jgi:thioester reductase-like protein
MSVREWLNKSIFITGTTGFVGKVLLEKILREVKSFRTIYLLVRSKPKMTLQQRVTQEILASKLFIPLFTERPELLPSLREKIVPVYGDLMQEGLGMSPKDRQMVVDDADVFISSAASINFNDPIPDALQVNYYGARRVLELAKESKRVECLVHISTVFVNSDLKKNTFIKEEMREWKDYEEVVAQAE